MNLGISYSQHGYNNLDRAAISSTTQEIFKRASKDTSALSKIDLNLFNRPSVGTDLYSNNTDTNTALQIATYNNTQLQQSTAECVSYLNTYVGTSLYNRKKVTKGATISFKA